MQANLTHKVTFDHLNLQVMADGEHSVPTELRITTNDGGNVLVHLPAVTDKDKPGAVANLPVSFKTLTGTVIRFTVEAVRQVTTINWYSEKPIVLPFAIASIGLPGVHFTPEDPAAQIPPVCRDNLMTIDGNPVWLKVSGTVGTAESQGGLVITGCGPDAHGIHLGPGTHTVVTQWGDLTGLDVDRLVFDSAAGGGAERLLANGDAQPVAGTIAGSGVAALPAPAVRLLSSTATGARLAVSGASGPFWLVLGESINAGWTATIAGGRSLGGSTLIDGFANGWYVDPTGSSFRVDLSWTPQHEVDIALVLSAVAIFACLMLAFLPWDWRRRRRLLATTGPGDEPDGPAGVEPEQVEHRSIDGEPAVDHEPDTEDEPVTEIETLTGAGPFAGGWPATLATPWRADGRPASLFAAISVAVIAGALCALVLPPGWTLPIGGAMALAALATARYAGTRIVLTAGAVAAAVFAGVATVVGQMGHHYPPGDYWPGISRARTWPPSSRFLPSRPTLLWSSCGEAR